MDDLKSKICRTPLEPLQTFMDDPLRVLRSVRFAHRFDLSIPEEIYQAARDPRVRDAFEHKITSERITKEMDKMFSNREPQICV